MNFKNRKYIVITLFIVIFVVIIFSFDPSKDYKDYDFKGVDLSFTDSLVYNFNHIIPQLKGNKNYDQSSNKLQKHYMYRNVDGMLNATEQEKKHAENIYSVALNDTLSLNINLEEGKEYKFYFFLRKGISKYLKVLINGNEIETKSNYSTRYSTEFQFPLSAKSKVQFVRKDLNDRSELFIGKPQIFTQIKRRPKHLLWTVIDALRQDIFQEEYKNIIPTLYQFSKDQQWFKRATNSANWTRPSTVSFLSGKFVKNISQTYSTDTFPIDTTARKFFYKNIGETAASIFNSLNFDVLSIINNIFLHNASVGYETGFPLQIICDSDIEDEEVLADALLQYINAHANRDLFIFFNSNTCHARYRVDILNYIKAIKNLPVHIPNSRTKYYGSAAVADEMMTHIFDNLKKMNIYNNMKMILHSDHGEFLRGETYYYKNNKKKYFKRHGGFMMPEVFNVPLIFKGFNFKENINKVVSLVDILPSLTDYYSIENIIEFDGNSLNKNLNNRSYFLTGDSQFGYINQKHIYEAYSNRLFRFTNTRNKVLEEKLIRFPLKDSIRNKYFKKYLPIKKLALFNSNIAIESTKNLLEMDIMKFGNSVYRVFEITDFPFSVKSKTDNLVLQKTGKKIAKGRLEQIDIQYFQKNLQEDYVSNKSQQDFFFNVYTVVGISTSLQKMDSDLRNQLQKWGYIQ